MLLIVKRGNLTLADGADWTVGRLTAGLPFEVERLIEVVPLLGAAGVSVFDRTTRSVSVEFVITREHADEGAALVFAATHDALATGKADLRFQFTVSGTTYTLRCKGAAWRAITVDPVGLSTDTTYRVEGRPFTVTSSVGAVDEYVEGGDGYDQTFGPIPGVLDGGIYTDNGVDPACAVHSPEY